MARDRFQAKLKCPKCGATGVAKLSEEDGWSYVKGSQETKVESLSEGFVIVNQRSKMASVDFHCKSCCVSAV